ncbi:MAG: hypothetical protein RLZZ227_1589 [Pseudomonadota bacterium]|jgi:hypothetical protein
MKTSTTSKASQQGVIFLALVLVLFVAGSTVAISALNNRQSRELQERAEVRYQMGLAKAALLSYAASSAQLYDNERGPGFFPCPDTGNDGEPEGGCNSNTAVLGRLPEYQVLPDNRRFYINDTYANVDGQFWYVVAPRYVYDTATTTNRRSRLRTAATYAAPYWLNLDGKSEYVALIIAPGNELTTQSRRTGPTNYANYLDGLNGASGFNYYTSYDSNPELFNDEVIGITLDEYMLHVGTAVAREVKAVIDVFAAGSFGAYPGDSGAINSVSCSAFTGTTFSNLFDNQAAWLRDNSLNNNGNNNERWSCPSGMWWNRDASPNTGVGVLKLNGCDNLSFTLTFGGGITRTGTRC